MRRSKTFAHAALAVSLLGCTGSIDDAGPDTPSAAPGVPAAPSEPRVPASGGAPPASPLAPPPSASPPPTGAAPPPTSSPAGASCRRGIARAPLRRLTATEYRNTVRDVFPELALPALTLPSDDKVAGFTNVVDPLGDDLLPVYIDAAYAIAAAAVATPRTLLGACDPAKAGEEACVRQLLDTVAARAWRRPLDTAEKDAALAGVFRKARATAGWTAALEQTVAWLLLAPDFLYHAERGVPAPALGTDVRQLTGLEIASALSYLLHRRPPDEALTKAAVAGDLATPAARVQHAKRLLADAKAMDMVWSFHREWLHIDRLDGATKDAKLFPQFDEALRSSMEEESRRFVWQIFQESGGSIRDLLLRRTSFVDARLAPLYGAPKPASGWAPVEWPAAGPRGGILGHASFLAAHATANDVNAVVFRGVAIRTGLLCLEVPPPPPEVDVTSNADRLAVQPCAACHALIDPIGRALDGFDAIGRARTGAARPTAGAIAGTPDIDGPVNGPGELAQALARSRQTSTCLATQWLRHALARPLGDDDACLLSAIDAAQAAAPGLAAVILAHVAHPDFILRREPITGGTCP